MPETSETAVELDSAPVVVDVLASADVDVSPVTVVVEESAACDGEVSVIVEGVDVEETNGSGFSIVVPFG